MIIVSDQVGEVGNARQGLVDGELEGDGGEQEDKRQLQTVLRLLEADGERRERHAADEKLRHATRPTASVDEARAITRGRNKRVSNNPAIRVNPALSTINCRKLETDIFDIFENLKKLENSKLHFKITS